MGLGKSLVIGQECLRASYYSSIMEVVRKLPFDVQRLVMSPSDQLCDSTMEQMELFLKLSPNLQTCIFEGDLPTRSVLNLEFNRCPLECSNCYLSFCLLGVFETAKALEEHPLYLEHGMRSKCKCESLRREERRKERLEAIAQDKNWDVVLENSKLRFADPCYDRSLCWEHYRMLKSLPYRERMYSIYNDATTTE